MLRVRELLMTDFTHLSTARSRLPSCLVDSGGNDKVAIHSLAAASGAIVVCSHDLIFKQGRREPALRLLQDFSARDLRPGNYGAGYRAFDPALDPFQATIGIGGGIGVACGVHELTDGD